MTIQRGKVFDGGQWYIWARRISLFLAPEPLFPLPEGEGQGEGEHDERRVCVCESSKNRRTQVISPKLELCR
ncbi:MAG: hypothetical protein DME26_01860 [Verrucomicrobia bacterium]|nr:MAG: hypothetical protein DME26_01860 [Verrucomicrobiota bacterium]